MVVSLAVHYLDMVRYLTGEDFVEVSAKGRYDQPFKNGAESCSTAMLTLSNGATGTLHANYLARKCPAMEHFNLMFDQGYVGNCHDWKYGSTRGKPAESFGECLEGLKPIPDDESLPDTSDFINQLLAFNHAVKTGSSIMSDLNDNFNTMAVIDAIYESMQNGGQGIRFPWVWSFGGDHFGTVEVDGVPTPAMEACGSNGKTVGMRWSRVVGQLAVKSCI